MPTKTPSGMDAFNAALDQVLSVSRAEFEEYERRYRKAAAKNSHKRGPKPKRASRASVERD